MNLFKIIADLEKVDPEMTARLTHRRSALTLLGDLSKKFALAAAPIAIGSAFNKAMGQNTLSAVNDVLNFALTLEYLEEDFYAQALAAPTLAANLTTGSAARNAIQTIKNHETAHVTLLKGALGTAAVARPASFNFGTAFATYASFLTFAQAFEDTGVRAYKGQAGTLKTAGNPNNVLQTALQIHSVEARHAAHVRYMRRAVDPLAASQYGWVTNAEANGAPAAVYNAGNPATTFPAESNFTQAALDLRTQLGTTYTAAEVSEAFDEALDNTTVLAIARSAATF
ncbi:ferritin-like domain-containing protein [Hymenobacter busanensis]|uniref:Ferritin-like domain-containing protein n=1 Tax=Hymenobacter busanensis TaxID=2607656 RepID=A0A7L4ZZR9_9BACT|nr:ferritin-like domain-containing protein [Hymenobacter busanensis]KAA9338543.1 ferritin-like domain-containing protein [Hymenobacter busanensis]QHJ09029.1 ferritin-like domain-containing protein [Hymenobacter busanensis]